uniref:Uncharacterized protein n=1 Tax=Meloidogyne incognita TaxID=6306 RepID=A0A914KMK9_MELIC
MLVWATFASHKSEATAKVMRELKLGLAFVHAGCAKFAQSCLFHKHAGLSNPLVGSADDSIACFKSDGPIAKEVFLFCVKCVQFLKEEMGATSNRTFLTVI